MAKTGKRNKIQEAAAEAPGPAELLYRQGLYAGGSAEPGPPRSRPDLAVYAAVSAALWVFCYALVGSGALPFAHKPALVLALALSGLALAGAWLLFRAGPAPRPADRTAAMVLLLTILDFWLWAWARPFTGLAAQLFVFIDLAGFAVLVFSVYMFVFRELHIELVVKALTVKAFFDFAAYVLSGGFGIEILGRLGLAHPLHPDALFTLAMLELWALLVYILKYRNKITQVPE